MQPAGLIRRLFSRNFASSRTRGTLRASCRITPNATQSLITVTHLRQPCIAYQKQGLTLCINVPCYPDRYLCYSFPSHLVNERKRTTLATFHSTILTSLSSLTSLYQACSLRIASLCINNKAPAYLPLSILRTVVVQLTQGFPTTYR